MNETKDVEAALRLAGLHFAGQPERVYRPKRHGVRRSYGYEDCTCLAARAHAKWAKVPTDFDHVVVAATWEPFYSSRYYTHTPKPFWVGVSKNPNHAKRTFDYRVLPLTQKL